MSLEEKLRDLAKRGEITHLSLVPRGKVWAATYTPSGVFGRSFEEDKDPVVAIEKAIAGVKLGRRKGKPAAAEPVMHVDHKLGRDLPDDGDRQLEAYAAAAELHGGVLATDSELDDILS